MERRLLENEDTIHTTSAVTAWLNLQWSSMLSKPVASSARLNMVSLFWWVLKTIDIVERVEKGLSWE